MPPPRHRVLEGRTHSVAETIRLGRALGRNAQQGDVFALYGPLGAGKTHLAKGIAAGAGFDQPKLVTSPTFVLIHEYAGRLPVYHIDAYRLGGTDEMLDLGSEEIFHGNGVCIVEWADRVAETLPAERMDIHIGHSGPRERTIHLEARGEHYAEMLDRIRERGYFKDTVQ
jgi:tRNA threonylcarbamoyladenosine biosynthesis protein TsaE